MSLRYASRVLWRAAQAVRARQPVVPGAVKPPTAGGAPYRRPPQGGQSSGSGGSGAAKAGASAERAIEVDKSRRNRRVAQKAENVMHLVCWGPN